MFVFLFVFLSIEDTNEVFDTLTPMEIEEIDKLPEIERLYLLNRIKTGTFPTRRDWSNVNKGEMFFASDTIKVDQVVDESNFIGFYEKHIWFEGVNTTNLSDDVRLDTNGALFFCDGNKQYTTVLGASKTVMKVVRVRPEGALELLRAIAEPRGYHVWGEGGEQLVVAKYLSSSSRSIAVQSIAGKRKTIKRSALTPVDEEWVSEQEAAEKSSAK